jgi:hypothetical protein
VKGRWLEALMAVVGVVAGMVALPSTATATRTHACITTIGLTGTTGIGVTTKQWRSTNPLIGEKSVRRARRYAARQDVMGVH